MENNSTYTQQMATSGFYRSNSETNSNTNDTTKSQNAGRPQNHSVFNEKSYTTKSVKSEIIGYVKKQN